MRNRTKRRLRALMAARLDRLPAGTDVVVRANSVAAQADSRELGAELDGVLSRGLARLAQRSQPSSADRGAVMSRGAAATVQRVLAAPLIGVIVFYQRVISPMTPPTCRYYPSCSAYALTAIQRFGPFKGTWLAVKRLVRCHPWTAGGVDHVPRGARRRQERPLHAPPTHAAR